ncbi:hypothetical protein [Ectopseudomonas oleovorans]|uniref:hypothetical protein n=1 Tax=Ectopseudomonas oleovorans TaxID=301 RepID=UPI001BAF6789|nr:MULTISPECIES: hypothetical protein [Pseudomonas]
MIIQWIVDNKEWLFGGIAVSIPLALLGLFFSRRGKSQKQRGGKGSVNIQVGGDLSLGDKKDVR